MILVDGVSRSTRRATVARCASTIALVALGATPLAAQQGQHPNGDGFLFGAPTGAINIRGGYSRASASSDLQSFSRKQFTIGPRGFDAVSFGVDLNVYAAHRLDIALSVDGSARSRATEYRDWLDNNDKPIAQTTKISTIGVLGSVRYNFREHGRRISNFAWIPTAVVPYVGVGGGLNHYQFTQDGDFIDFGNGNAVSSDVLTTANWGPMAQAFGGMEFTASPRWTIFTEARYTQSSAKLNKDYSDFGRIDLSGLAMHLGAGLRY